MTELLKACQKPLEVRKGGSISLTSGIASQRPGIGLSFASGICGAMEGFTRAMTVELAPIRVNAVMPGVIQTDLWKGMTEEAREQFYHSVGISLLVKRIGQPEDIGQIFVFIMKQSFQPVRHSLLMEAQFWSNSNRTIAGNLSE